MHSLESTLRSQFIGVEVALVRGLLVLSGSATPGVHTAVLAIVANLLQSPVSVPVGVGVVSPDLGLDLPLLGAAAGIELPDLGRVIRMLGVVDRIQVIRESRKGPLAASPCGAAACRRGHRLAPCVG